MKYKILLIAIVFSTLTGCLEVLDKHDLGAINATIWENQETAEMYINMLYDQNMPDMSLSANSFYSDEAFTSESNTSKLLTGQVDNADFSTFYVGVGTDVFHKDNYKLIRTINIAIDGLKESSLEEEAKGLLLGQARFLRAYRYWEIIKLYGGIPMILYTQDPFTDNLDVARNTTAECVAAVVEDLDYAMEHLPENWDTNDLGRITKGAAAAYKGRVLLNWASPIFNRENKPTRWDEAYEANKEANEICMASGAELIDDFSMVFTTSATSNPEAIFFSISDAELNSAYATGWESVIRPKSAGGGSGVNPTWELVKAFPMQNGKWIKEQGSGYDSTYFWQDRDDRFYATIGYNGCEWEVAGREQTIQWAYDRNAIENNTKPGTGFYNKKASDPTLHIENTSLGSQIWHELRYAEVLLNLAESANEVGNTQEALDNLYRIRERAGIEAGVDGRYGIKEGVSKAELLEIIVNERRVEFAFENKRYWDLRRHLMYRNSLGKYTPALNGTFKSGFLTKYTSAWGRRISVDKDSPYYGWKKVDTAAYFGHINIDDQLDYETYFTTEINILAPVQGGIDLPYDYKELYDFFAVPNAMLNSSDSIMQTVNWFDGTFDPLVE